MKVLCNSDAYKGFQMKCATKKNADNQPSGDFHLALPAYWHYCPSPVHLWCLYLAYLRPSFGRLSSIGPCILISALPWTLVRIGAHVRAWVNSRTSERVGAITLQANTSESPKYYGARCRPMRGFVHKRAFRLLVGWITSACGVNVLPLPMSLSQFRPWAKLSFQIHGHIPIHVSSTHVHKRQAYVPARCAHGCSCAGNQPCVQSEQGEMKLRRMNVGLSPKERLLFEENNLHCVGTGLNAR